MQVQHALTLDGKVVLESSAMGWLPVIRPEERRDAAVAFATLLVFVAAHTMLETARDALFLARVPVTRLPWMMVGIAALTLLLTGATDRIARKLVGPVAVSAWAALIGLCTMLLFVLLERLGASALYVLYLWSGVLPSLVLVPLWLLLSDLFLVTQAKRLYGPIGTGSVLGAIVGSGAARVLVPWVHARGLVAVAAAGFLLSALLPLAFRRKRSHHPHAPPAREQATLRYVVEQAYVRNVAALLFASVVALTLADYVFKSVVVRHVPPEHLGSYLSTLYFSLNVLSLLVQVLLVGWMVRRFELGVASALLPLLLCASSLGLLAGGGLSLALCMRAADGGLRHSLHRTTTELLFVPLPDEARRRIKAFAERVVQRGAQILGSVLILATLAAGAKPAWLVACLALVAVVWTALALRIRHHYLAMFRRRLHGGVPTFSAFPDMDVASLETLVATLDSQNDDEVVAALDVLEREGKERLVPALILHHPSPRVLTHVLELFARAGRTQAVAGVERLLQHAHADVRAAAVTCCTTLDPSVERLRAVLQDETSPDVRVTVLVHRIALGDLRGDSARRAIESILDQDSSTAQVALATAIARAAARELRHVLVQLARAPALAVRLATIDAMTRVGALEFVPQLIELHAEESTRTAAKLALVQLGDPGFDAVVAALHDASLRAGVRWHLPQLVQSFSHRRAAHVLVEQLTQESDGMVRYRTLRALEWLLAREPTIPLRRTRLEASLDATIRRAYTHLARRRVLGNSPPDADAPTPGHDLLAKMLHDKEHNAHDRIVRLLGLLHPTENFDDIRRGLRSNDKATRASSLELIGGLLDADRRAAVLALLDDGPDVERMRAGGRFQAAPPANYRQLLRELVAGDSAGLRELAVFHIGELRLVELLPQVEALPPALPEVDRTRALLVPLRAQVAPC